MYNAQFTVVENYSALYIILNAIL